jgi:hypothetical protein
MIYEDKIKDKLKDEMTNYMRKKKKIKRIKIGPGRKYPEDKTKI